MKAYVDNRPVDLPDPKAFDGLVLVRVTHSFERKTNRRQDRADVLALARRRIKRGIQAARLDGVGVMQNKVRHFFRREFQYARTACASFVGHVVRAPVSSGFRAGQRVAGVSPSYPAHTEYALARPDFVFPLSADANADLATRVLHGGIAVKAIEMARRQSSHGIVFAGDGEQAHLARQIARLLDCPVSRHGDTLIATRLPRRPDAEKTGTVIGLDLSATEIARCWPGASERIALSVRDMCGSTDYETGFYHREENTIWPDWYEPAPFARYLELVEDGGLANVAPGSQVKRFPAATDSPTAPPPKDYSPTPLTLREKRSDAVQVSLLGAGHHALGTPLRQLSIRPDFELRGACDYRPDTLHLAAKTLDFQYTTTDVDRVFDDPETDLVMIATYHETHATYAASALRAGKHCFVEKPPAITQDDLDVLRSAHAETDGILWSGFNRRFSPAIRELLPALREESGPVTINVIVRPAEILNQKTWILNDENGGSRLVSNACHQIDTIGLLVCGARPISVQTRHASTGRPDFNAAVFVAFDDGSIANIVFTERGRDQAGKSCQEYYTIMKGELTAHIDNFRRLRLVRKNRESTPWRGDVDKGHRALMAAVAKSILEKDREAADADFTFETVKLYLAMDRSMRTGEAVSL